jgi:hypothetical protein
MSPNIASIAVKTSGYVRRAKLYYLRSRTGRQALRVKEKVSDLQKSKQNGSAKKLKLAESKPTSK